MRDMDIRRALRREMTRLHGDDQGTRVVEELGLCQGSARIDLAVINGNIHGYEIKSDQDTLERLRGQSEIYNRVLDYVTIIVSPSHVRHVMPIVPNWWGISIASAEEGEVVIRERRLPRRNAAADSFALAQLLWRGEALAALEGLGLAEGMHSKRREFLWRRLAEKVPTKELGRIVRDRLKSRASGWRALSQRG
jgi:hypothetical protein